MNYRLIIRWQRTCEVNTTLFNGADDAWLTMHCLDCAGEPIGEWSNLRWD